MGVRGGDPQTQDAVIFIIIHAQGLFLCCHCVQLLPYNVS